ncbi:MAG TPA: replication-associated recombination protein A [Candidatus Binataceae bacterium]
MARRKPAPGAADRGLFASAHRADRPLADRMRPQSLDEVVGQDHLLGPGKLLSQIAASGRLHSLILWGPPGVGKTTIANLLAQKSSYHFVAISAVMAGIADLRAVVAEARVLQSTEGKRTALLVDEIHRWNRAQQDGFLPHVESGLVTLFGATTENPSFELIAPLLSRARVVVLHALSEDHIAALLKRALTDAERGLGSMKIDIEESALAELARLAAGDARRALNTMEIAASLAAASGGAVVLPDHVREAAQRKTLLYDRAGEEHYNVISAFIKSMRGSDPDAAIYWMMRMIEAGEDPLFIARRMVIFASEDVSNADPRALQIALAVKEAVEFVGLPEGAIALAQGVTYLASSPKSNASFKAMNQAREDAVALGALPVPMHLRNAPTPLMKQMGYGADYRYPHDYDDAAVEQQYLPDRLIGKKYYYPSNRGYEARIRELRELRARGSALKQAQTKERKS